MRVNATMSTKIPVGTLAKRSVDVIKKAHSNTLTKTQQEAKLALKNEIKRKLKTTKDNTSNVRSRIYKDSTTKEASMFLFSAASFYDVHRRGKTLKPSKSSYMFLPVYASGKRLRRATFQRLISQLKSQGLLYYKKKGDKLLVFAKVKKGAKGLGSFKRASKQRSGAKSIKSGESVLIAVGIREVRLKKRLDIFEVRQKLMDKIAVETMNESHANLNQLFN